MRCRCVAHPARGRRNRRAFVSGRGARRRLAEARRRHRARHRHARRAFQISRPRPCTSFRAPTLRGRNPLALARTAAMLTLGTARAWSMLGRIKPAVVVGFGGYPTVPPLMAATLRGIPTVLHEQNGVMGRANRLLAARVTTIATGFPHAGAARPAPAGQDHLHRQSGARRGDRRGGDALCRAGAERKDAPAGVRRQPGRARDGRDRAGGARAHAARCLRARLAVVQQARGRGSRRGARDLRPARDRSRVRAVLCRSAGAHGGRPSGDCPLRRLDRGRAVGHRPAGHSGAAAAFAGSGPVRQCRRCWRTAAGRSASSSATSPPSGWLPQIAAWPAIPGGSPPWRQPPNRLEALDAAERLARAGAESSAGI